MSAATRFRVNTPNVAWEDFEDEVIVVNLESGEYFSTRETGAEIWRRLANGTPTAAVARVVLAQYEVEAAALEDSLSTFVAELQERGLLVPDDVAHADEDSVALEPAVSARRLFQQPTLATYTDMQDLLLLDSIHEVDESGWPNRK